MARYYLHMRSGDRIESDLEGSELSDLNAARNEALQSAREILAEAIISPNPDLFDSFVIADESGRELETVALRDALPKAFAENKAEICGRIAGLNRVAVGA
jgi:hypothetical protein